MMTGAAPEFSRMLDVAEMRRQGGLDLVLAASAPERAALAKRLGVPALRTLSVQLRAAPWRDDGVRLEGRLTADLTQLCVVTLEPLEAHIEEPLLAHFLPAQALPDAARAVMEELQDPDAPDPPEPLPAKGVIDVGELAVQCLSVSLDPYPRKAGVVFNLPEGADAALAKPNPFAKLAQLKTPQKG